ncbi:MAG: cation-translocating P-type ATPase [Actinobacteria bacterium]|nr:cation-translocating P-type ATPase [Actinomycetota bacterium]MCB9413663.1 cation-translocating P-type ATPase [Actinomycetota bacterium]MCB9424639.1 cation-translocating P-type ATPase [Actinomycetota bacterium]
MTQSVSERLVYTQSAQSVLEALRTSPDEGLGEAEAEQRLDRYGRNVLPRAPVPTAWRIALRQWAEPMNVMLTVVALVSVLIGQEETALLVGFLVLLNVVLGSRQELKAQASVAALASLQVPSARVLRSGTTIEISAEDLVPGDMVMVEAGDLIPADGRIVTSAALEVAESALTGESAPVAKDARALHDPDAALGDRTNMLFQNTSVTRGTATFVVTGTGAGTEMGRIADMLNAVDPVPSPLQKEMRSLSIRLMWVAWVAVAIIVGLGVWRGGDLNAVVLLGITTAIAAIPSGLPTFLTAMLSYGAQRLAHAKAVVKNLNDVETLGAISAINSDKTGTLTMDMMTATRMFAFGQWFSIEGSGYQKSGAILHAAGQAEPDFDALGYGLALCGDATVDDQGVVIGDPTEAALVVLAAKMGVDAQTSRREYPREAEVPFDSVYKFMATFHIAPMDEQTELIGLVKGAPDVVLERCSSAYLGDDVVAVDGIRDKILQANDELAAQGLRVMSFAITRRPVEDLARVQDDPMAAVADLTFVALVGIIDPLRPSAKEAVSTALSAGIDVRMITGDHAVTARAIGSDLGLGPGVITGPEFQALSDAQIYEQLPELHVFGRVAPEDKLRLVSVMQERAEIVAMTGDAVNDAAALKKADVGVAMGSGSEVSKESAKMILTDDNFATLVHAIELGRDIYGKITAQIRYVLIGLFGFVTVMLAGSILNLNSGSVLNPLQLLFVSFLIGLFPAIGISTDSTEPGIMQASPRDPGLTILNATTAPRWIAFGLVQAGACLLPFVWLSELGPQRAQTMTFAILAISTVLLAVSARRDLLPATAGPYFPYFAWMGVPAVLTVMAVETDFFQRVLDTTSLTGSNWLAVGCLSLVVPAVMEASKAFRRSRSAVRTTSPAPPDAASD